MIQISKLPNAAGYIVVLAEGQTIGGLSDPGQFLAPSTDPPGEIEAAILAALEAGEAVLVDGPPSPAPPSATDLAAYAKGARDAKENGGITVQGVPTATDDRSKLLVAGARMRADDNPNGTEMWAAADGREYPLPASAIVLISKAIGAHVSACFVCYASVKAALTASPPTITDQAGVDAAFAAVSTAY